MTGPCPFFLRSFKRVVTALHGAEGGGLGGVAGRTRPPAQGRPALPVLVKAWMGVGEAGEASKPWRTNERLRDDQQHLGAGSPGDPAGVRACAESVPGLFRPPRRPCTLPPS